MPIPIKKIKELILDERKAAKEYREMGLPALALDEEMHQIFFESMLPRKRGRGGLL